MKELSLSDTFEYNYILKCYANKYKNQFSK